jgi:alkylation response protein AidB-like acyl-CoA dehydrogenase
MAIHDPPALGEDEHALRDTLRGFLADQLPPDTLRAVLETDPGYSPELHARLAAELGLARLTIPEEFGGLGLPQAEASVVHAELGRALYPGPFLPSALASGALLAAGNRDAAERWLPRLAEGSATGTVAASGENGHWSPGPDSVQAKHRPHSWQLTGQRWYVIGGHVADVILVPASTGSGLGMFLVQPESPGFTVTGQLSLDHTRRVSVAAFDAVPAMLLAEHVGAVAALNRAERELLLATAAEAAGGIGWCLDATIEYARDREQFGHQAGSFRAAADACVGMLAALQSASAASYGAVAADDDAAGGPIAAHVAALQAGEAYRAVTETAIHLFGGTGFTREHDAQLHYRRAWSAERLAGGPQAHRAAIADLTAR